MYGAQIVQHVERLALYAQVLDKLIAAGASLDAVQRDNFTALHLAAQTVSSEVRVDWGRCTSSL